MKHDDRDPIPEERGAPPRRRRKVLPTRTSRRNQQITNPGPPGDRGGHEKEAASQGGEYIGTGKHSRPMTPEEREKRG